jgi:hypothetical protein
LVLIEPDRALLVSQDRRHLLETPGLEAPILALELQMFDKTNLNSFAAVFFSAGKNLDPDRDSEKNPEGVRVRTLVSRRATTKAQNQGMVELFRNSGQILSPWLGGFRRLWHGLTH